MATKTKQPKLKLPTANKRNMMIAVSVLLVALVGGGIVYKSQAASHVTTMVHADEYTSTTGDKYKIVNIPKGKGTVKALWIKKSTTSSPAGWTVVDRDHTYLAGKTYQACYSMYNTKSNLVDLQITGVTAAYGSGTSYPLGHKLAQLLGASKLQQSCVNFTPTVNLGRIHVGYSPLTNNGIIYKVTIIRL